MTGRDISVGRPIAELARWFTREARPKSKIMIVSDGAVATRQAPILLAALRRSGFEAGVIRIPPGETSKTLARAGDLCRLLARKRFERSSWLIALGGGVVGDLTGFVAATFLRGIPFVQVPTTLLAQVDASIGGKTGVDIPEGKNLVGSFYLPRVVWIDPSVLKSLPVRHWRNGLAEVIKYGAILDADLFRQLERHIAVLREGYASLWPAMIRRCACLKWDVVRRDPQERSGLRAILNFGHSVGHAVEAAGHFRDYLHGEAISIGMVVAARLSAALTGLKVSDGARLEQLLLRAGLPVRPRYRISRQRIMDYLARDKKVQDGRVQFVLLNSLGQAVSGQAVAPDRLSSVLGEVGL